MKNLAATDGWLLHFTVAPVELPLDPEQAAASWLWPDDNASFRMMHVWHDRECTRLRVFWREHKDDGGGVSVWTLQHKEIELGRDSAATHSPNSSEPTGCLK